MAQSDDPRHRPERYRHLFYDDAQTVPVNKLGIKDLNDIYRLENQARDEAYLQLHTGEIALRGPLTVKVLMELHRKMFGRLFEWAGRPRGLELTPWVQPQFLQEHLEALERNVLAKHAPVALKTDEQFCDAASEIHGEFIVVHPFWNGNHRTIQLAIDALARATGRPVLNYDRTEQARERFTRATEMAFRTVDYSLLKAIMREALHRARSLAPAPGPLAPHANADEERLDAALKELPASRPKLEIKR